MVKALAVLFLAVAPQAWGMPEKPLHYVSDFDGILEDSVESSLNARIKGLQAAGKAEIAVVTIGSLEGKEPKAYANELFKNWGIGQKGKNNGVLILVAPNERKIWIEVGYGLEPILPDGLAGEVIREQFLPAFKRGDYPGGIVAGTERITVILEKGARAPPTPPEVSPLWSYFGYGLITIPFLGIFITIGFYLAGCGLGARQYSLVFWGFGFGGIPLFMTLSYWLLGFPVLALWGYFMLFLGYSKGRSNPKAFKSSGGRGGFSGSGSSWDFGGSGGGGEGFSSGGGSDFGGFGGGSSGGGGAGGSW